MIQLVNTDRKPTFKGVTPMFIIGGTFFFAAILTSHFVGIHLGNDFTPCLFKIVTHKPCFLCGGTRASLKLASGHPVQAFFQNPLVTVIHTYVAAALLLKFAFAKKLSFGGPFKDRRFLWMIAITLVTANWIYMIRTL